MDLPAVMCLPQLGLDSTTQGMVFRRGYRSTASARQGASSGGSPHVIHREQQSSGRVSLISHVFCCVWPCSLRKHKGGSRAEGGSESSLYVDPTTL
eukprot:4139579-Pleurochrysis_carterae.AAC.1